MKYQTDQKTMDLLRSPGAARAAAFKKRQVDLGRRQRPLWLTDVEFELLKNVLERFRADKS